ncbi:MAG: DUF4360 domain-containing protein [Polyangiales bacterium]
MIPPARFALSAALVALAASVGTAPVRADAPTPSAPDDAPAAPGSALQITAVDAAQACDGEWTAEIGPAGDGAFLALLGTDASYTIDVRPDGVTESRLSNCTLNVSMQVAPGISYAVARVSYEGRASLDPGVSAETSVAYNFVDGPMSPRVSHRTEGPYAGTVSMDQSFPEDGLVWSSCEDPKPLQVRASLYLHNADPQQNGWLSMALAEGVQMVVLDFITRPCPAAPSASEIASLAR